MHLPLCYQRATCEAKFVDIHTMCTCSRAEISVPQSSRHAKRNTLAPALRTRSFRIGRFTFSGARAESSREIVRLKYPSSPNLRLPQNFFTTTFCKTSLKPSKPLCNLQELLLSAKDCADASSLLPQHHTHLSLRQTSFTMSAATSAPGGQDPGDNNNRPNRKPSSGQPSKTKAKKVSDCSPLFLNVTNMFFNR